MANVLIERYTCAVSCSLVFKPEEGSKQSLNKVVVPEWLSGMTRNHVGFAF
jgi:hypothetical protein